MTYEISSDEVREKLLEFMGLDLIPSIGDPDTSAVEAARYAVLNRGHMLRPLLAVRATQVFDNTERGISKVIPSAAAIEYVHNATLMIDDVQDNSRTRRGQPAVWVKYDVPTANNTGFYLVGKAITSVARGVELKASQKTRVLEITGTAAINLVTGQQKDLAGKNGGETGWIDRVKQHFISLKKVNNNPDVPSTLEEVIKTYEFKTGVLFSSAAMIGGVVGGVTDGSEDYERLRNFGNFVGIAYQIGDDIYDRAGKSAEGGKPTGQDEGSSGVVEFEGLDGAYRLLSDYMDRAKGLSSSMNGEWIHLHNYISELEELIKKLTG